MPRYLSPDLAYEDINKNFVDKKQFEYLVEICDIWSKYNDPGIVFKKFIPNKIDYSEFGFVCQSEEWDQNLCDTATRLLIEAYTIKNKIFDSYVLERTKIGNFLAFTTINEFFCNHFGNYISDSGDILRNGLQNGIVISGEEWLSRFPFESYSSFKNRSDALDWYVTIKKRAMVNELFENDNLNKLFVNAILDGGSTFGSVELYQIQNIKKDRFSFVKEWKPSSEFKIVYKLAENNGFNPPSEEKKKKMISIFLNDFPKI